MSTATRWMRQAVQLARAHRRDAELVGLTLAGLGFILWVIAFRN